MDVIRYRVESFPWKTMRVMLIEDRVVDVAHDDAERRVVVRLAGDRGEAMAERIETRGLPPIGFDGP